MRELTVRQYGEEFPSDVYDPACKDGCRLRCFNRCEALGRCKLEVTPDRRTRTVAAYFDCRRAILLAFRPDNGLTATTTCAFSRGLPYNKDPKAFYVLQLEDQAPDGGVPAWGVCGEGFEIDGPYDISLMALRTRIDNLATKRRK